MRILCLGDTHLSSKSPVSRIDNYSEASLKKLDQIIQIVKEREVDLVLQTGDIFHVKDISFSYLGDILSRLDILRRATRRGLVWAILGNHDVLYRKYQSINRTVSGIVFRTGIFKLLEREVLDGWEFIGVSEGRDLIPARAASIMVGHAFLDSKLVPEESVLPEDLIKAGYTYVVLGHDHVPYTPLVYEEPEMTVIRPGALMRGTIHNYNMHRKVCVSLIDTNAGEKGTVENIEISVDPADSVLRTIKRDMDQIKGEIEEVLSNLFSTSGGLTRMINYVRDVYGKIREEMKADRELIEYLDLKFTEKGLI